MRGDAKAKMILVKCSTEWEEAVKSAMPFLNLDRLKNTIEFKIPCAVVVGIGLENEIVSIIFYMN